MSEPAPINEVIIGQRQQAVHIAQQVLPIILQGELARTLGDELTKDKYLDIAGADELPYPGDVVRYALQIGQEFIRQSLELINQPVPGMTGTT